MTRPLLWALPVALVLGVSPASAQTRATDPTLQAAFEAREKAITAKDAAEFSKYTTEDFVTIRAIDGGIANKKERMQTVANPPTPPIGTPVMDSVRMFGPDTAVTIHHNNTQRITQVWVKQAGTWKVASAHGTLITKK